MIGSGWLFGGWIAARIAGPSAILCWPIGAVIIFLLAMSYAELGARYPASGGMVRYTQLSHGSLAGFIAGWANWIAIVSVIAIEAVSSIQYLSSWPFQFTHNLYDRGLHELTATGLLLSALLISFYFLLNYWSVKIFIRSMSYLTYLKVAVPLITCATLIITAYLHHRFDFSHQDFTPYGISGIFTAVATAGIIFSFNGFQSPINLSGEAKNPGRNVPLAVFFSLCVAFVLYVLLQYAFIGNVPPSELINGWDKLYYSSPFADLAIALNLNWLMILLYLDAFVSPSGTGITYTATTSRMLCGLHKNGYMPEFIGKIHPFYHIPRGAMWMNLLVSFAFLLIFRGWGQLVAVISVSTIISYVTGPVAAVSLRKWGKEIKSPLRIKGLTIAAPLAFITISWVLYWARWPLTGEVILIMVIGLPIYFYYQHQDGWKKFKKEWVCGIWLICYLLTLALASWLGSRSFGGHGYLNTMQSMTVVSLLAIIFYYWGLRSSYVRIEGKMG